MFKNGTKIGKYDEYFSYFKTCENFSTNDPILQYPDFSKPFNISTDDNQFALAAVLTEGSTGKIYLWHIVQKLCMIVKIIFQLSGKNC